jgi:hypothetical protein
MRFAARESHDQTDSVKPAVTYSSDSDSFQDVSCQRNRLFLRNLVSANGNCAPVTEISAGGFIQSHLSFVCISQTIEVVGPNCFEASDLSFLAFEFRGISRGEEKILLFDCSHGRTRARNETPLRMSERSFSQCKSLKSLCVPSAVTTIEELTFEYCLSVHSPLNGPEVL